jgi:hypothetical protein
MTQRTCSGSTRTSGRRPRDADRQGELFGRTQSVLVNPGPARRPEAVGAHLRAQAVRGHWARTAPVVPKTAAFASKSRQSRWRRLGVVEMQITPFAGRVPAGPPSTVRSCHAGGRGFESRRSRRRSTSKHWGGRKAFQGAGERGRLCSARNISERWRVTSGSWRSLAIIARIARPASGSGRL